MLSGSWSAADAPVQAALASGPATPWLVAHRGASAYAPENTVPAFILAAQQGATFVEFDLRLSKDGVIVCLHDETLDRTTDVEQVFPDRGRQTTLNGLDETHWHLEDFTLAELQRLDAGSWFGARFKGTRIPTFGETITALRGRAGLFIELKSPERYPGIEAKMLEELKAQRLDQPWADPRTPVLVQSFTASSLQLIAGRLGSQLPIHLLFSARDAAMWQSDEGLANSRVFATGLSPDKQVLQDDAGLVRRAHARGLKVTPYTFRADAVRGYRDVRAEMADYLSRLEVDGVITDNPDRMPGK